jgi:hypothetical protein
MTTTAPDLAAMPNEDQLERVLRLITHDLAGAMLKVSGPVKRIATYQGKEAPTLEDIGRLYVFVRDIEGALPEIEGGLRDIRESLYRLDDVRINDNVDPDPPDDV